LEFTVTSYKDYQETPCEEGIDMKVIITIRVETIKEATETVDSLRAQLNVLKFAIQSGK